MLEIIKKRIRKYVCKDCKYLPCPFYEEQTKPLKNKQEEIKAKSKARVKIWEKLDNNTARKKFKEAQQFIYNRQDEDIVRYVRLYVLDNDSYSDKEKIEILDYILYCIKKDIQIEHLSFVRYENRGTYYLSRSDILPECYYDENGVLYKMEEKEIHKKEISLKDDFVFAFPWNKKSMGAAIIDGFNYNTAYKATYYKGLDICILEIGKNHSVAAGIYKGEGTIQADVVDATRLFDHVDIEMGKFYDVHTKNKPYKERRILQDIVDFRFAALYEISRIRYSIVNYPPPKGSGFPPIDYTN